MDFFKQLSQIIDGVDINLTIRKSGDELTLLLQPKAVKESSKTLIKPLSMRATPQELDEVFFSTISNPVKKATGIIASIEVFETDMENVKKVVEEKARKKRESLSNKRAAPVQTVTPKKEVTQDETQQEEEEEEQEENLAETEVKGNVNKAESKETQSSLF